MQMRFRNTAAAKTTSGSDPPKSNTTNRWARLLCGLAAIVSLFPAVRARLQNQIGSSLSGLNANKTDDAPAKVSAGGRNAGPETENHKSVSSKSSRSPEATNDKTPNKQRQSGGEAKGKGKGVQNTSNRKGRKAKAKVKNETADTGLNVDYTSPNEMKALAGGLCLKMGLMLLGGMGMKFSSDRRAKLGLPDMYRMLVTMCCGSKQSSTAEGQYQESKGPDGVRLPSRSWLFKKIGGIRHDYMLKRCQRMVWRTVVRAKRHGMFRHPVIVAIDEHDIPFHAKVMQMQYSPGAKRAPYASIA